MASDPTTYTLPDGRRMTTEVRLPFAVRRNGTTRSFGSYAAARRAAAPGSTLFFDYAPGCGAFIEYI